MSRGTPESKCQSSAPVAASIANAAPNAVLKYSAPRHSTGVASKVSESASFASWPSSPVRNCHAIVRPSTLDGAIWLSGE